MFETSNSVSLNAFAQAKQAAIDIVNSLGVNFSGVSVGMVTYGSTVGSILEIKGDTLGAYAKYVIIAQIKNLVYTDGMTATGDALYTARTIIFNSSTFSHNVLVLFTASNSNYGLRNVIIEANELKKLGSIFTVGIGSGLSAQELNSIASTPTNEFKMTIGDYSLLYNYLNRIIPSICFY